MIQPAQIIKALNALKKFDDNKKIQVLNENNRIVLQFSQKYISANSEQFININLPNYHSEIKDTDICIFVKDNNKFERDYETTIEEFKQLFIKNNILTKIEIFPMKKLKIEFNDYEAKRRLSNSYEMFLADSRIFRLLPSMLGKHFISRKRLLTKVNFDVKDLKKEFDKALKTVHVCLRGHGPVSQCTVGYIGQSEEELLENIQETIKQISLNIEHGFQNIRCINLKMNASASVPLYVSIDDLVIDKSEEASKISQELPVLEDEISTVMNGRIRIGKDGHVVIVYDDCPKVDLVANTLDVPTTKLPRKRSRNVKKDGKKDDKNSSYMIKTDKSNIIISEKATRIKKIKDNALNKKRPKKIKLDVKSSIRNTPIIKKNINVKTSNIKLINEGKTDAELSNKKIARKIKLDKDISLNKKGPKGMEFDKDISLNKNAPKRIQLDKDISLNKKGPKRIKLDIYSGIKNTLSTNKEIGYAKNGNSKIIKELKVKTATKLINKKVPKKINIEKDTLFNKTGSKKIKLDVKSGIRNVSGAKKPINDVKVCNSKLAKVLKVETKLSNKKVAKI